MYKSLLEQVKCELKSVKSVTLIFDSWTHKYRKMPYLGIRLAVINDKWDFKIFTLSCTPLEYHTAENIKSHIKDIINEFFPRRSDQLRFHSVHDGAANMMKSSKLLKIPDPQHCIAHVLHLLLTENGFKKVASVTNLLEKCRNIVIALSFKAYAISQEFLFKSDIAMYDKLKLLAEANEIMDLDEHFPYEAFSTDDEDLSHDSGHKSHCHISLKMQIAMR